MSDRKLRRFVDALSAGRRPKGFAADPVEAEVVRAAVDLRAARPGDDAPSDAFAENLFQQLAAERAQPEPVRTPRPAPIRRTRTAIASAAAALALVAGTAVTTIAVTGGGPGLSAASQVPRGTTLRTGTFQSAGGEVLGQIVAYDGKHPWVFMNVGLPKYDGMVTCTLQTGDGTTVAFGSFAVHNGTGQFSKAIDDVDVTQLRGARLLDAAGNSVAAATFAS